MGGGLYRLNNCSVRPPEIVALGGFIDFNGNGKLDADEPTQDSPLVVDSTVLVDVNLTITPISTLAAADETINRGTLATKLGFASRTEAYTATVTNQLMNQMLNAVLSSAITHGFDITVFSADLAHRIIISNTSGVAALQGAITSFVNASESTTTYGSAKLQSFHNDLRVVAVMNGTDVMGAMLAKKVPRGKLRISGLVTTTPTGSNIVSGATVSIRAGGTTLGTGVSDTNGGYSIVVDESAIPKNDTLLLSSPNLTSSIPTNMLLDKKVNGNINSSHIGSLAISNLTTSVDNYKNNPISLPCAEGQYLRHQTNQCLPLENPTWGFQGFSVPVDNVYPLLECTQVALQKLLNAIPKAGGKIVMPECTIQMTNGIKVPDNVILEGSGMGITILNNTTAGDSPDAGAVNLLGENIIVRNFTVNGNGTTVNGINGFATKGNILVEFIETKNFKSDQGSGISFLTENPLKNSRITARYNKSYNGLHGLAVKVWTLAKTLLYSNEAFGNRGFAMDLSTNDSIEVAGNYMHHNTVAGAKSLLANNIIYHHNNINYNEESGLVYVGNNTNHIITVKDNDISNNAGPAFACYNDLEDIENISDKLLYKLILKNNITTNSKDINGYTISAPGVTRIEVNGDHGNIWTANTYPSTIFIVP
jgi:hypothetical protein